jgi:hypothetical protein
MEAPRVGGDPWAISASSSPSAMPAARPSRPGPASVSRPSADSRSSAAACPSPTRRSAGERPGPCSPRLLCGRARAPRPPVRVVLAQVRAGAGARVPSYHPARGAARAGTGSPTRRPIGLHRLRGREATRRTEGRRRDDHHAGEARRGAGMGTRLWSSDRARRPPLRPPRPRPAARVAAVGSPTPETGGAAHPSADVACARSLAKHLGRLRPIKAPSRGSSTLRWRRQPDRFSSSHPP